MEWWGVPKTGLRNTGLDQWFLILLLGTHHSAHFLSGFFLSSWWSESSMLNKGDTQNVQSRCSGPGLKTTVIWWTVNITQLQSIVICFAFIFNHKMFCIKNVHVLSSKQAAMTFKDFYTMLSHQYLIPKVYSFCVLQIQSQKYLFFHIIKLLLVCCKHKRNLWGNILISTLK